MSSLITGLVYNCDLPLTEKAVLLSYADHADHDGNNIFPSVGYTAWKIGASERLVQKVTRKLERMGILVKDGSGPRGVNRYRIVIDALPGRERYKNTSKKGEPDAPPDNDRGEQGAPIESTEGAPHAPQERTPCTPPVNDVHPEGESGAPKPLINHQLNHPLTDHAGAGAPASPGPEDLPASVKNPSAYRALAQHEEKRRKAVENDADVNVSFYPENVQPVLLEVCRLWGLRPPRKVKARGGEYALWIEDSNNLIQAMGEFGLTVLHEVYDNWREAHHNGRPPYTVGRPGALIKSARAKAGELRNLQKTQPPVEYTRADLDAAAAASDYFNDLIDQQKKEVP